VSTPNPSPAQLLIAECSRLRQENNGLRTAIGILEVALETAIGRLSEEDPPLSKALRDFKDHAAAVGPAAVEQRAIEDIAGQALS
jgi:hypothetical protein